MRYLRTMLLVMVAVFALAMTQNSLATSKPVLPSVTITFVSVLSYDGKHSNEQCLVVGPFKSMVYQAPCEPVAQQVMAQLRRDNPLVAFNVVINGKSLNTI